MENKNTNIEKYFYPMTVSTVFGREDAKEEILERWDKFDVLSEEEKDVLISPETANAIKEVSVRFGFAQKEAEEIVRIVRSIFFREISYAALASELIRRVGGLSLESAKRIEVTLKEKIFLQVGKEKSRQQSTFVKLPIKQILEEYKQVGEQYVTEGEIMTKFFPDPIKPSINNWIMDFHDVLGGGKHSPIERGNYLFHSENGKKLSAEDRQKLGLIFKSLDEETPLTIDVKNEKIIFDLQSSSDQYQADSQNSLGNNQQVSSARSFGTEGDIFERYTPKNVQPTSSVNERVNSLEKFYAKYPENSVGSKASVSQVESNAQQVETESDKMQFAAQPKSFSPNFSFKIKDDQAAVVPVENNFANQTKNNFSPNFAGGNISFSSAQKFPAELEATQPEAPANTPFAQAQPVPTVSPKSPFIQTNLYHIGPRKSIEPEMDEITEQQRLFKQKNIVNLKQINNGDSTN